jgi:hypothetical protein
MRPVALIIDDEVQIRRLLRLKAFTNVAPKRVGRQNSTVCQLRDEAPYAAGVKSAGPRKDFELGRGFSINQVQNGGSG